MTPLSPRERKRGRSEGELTSRKYGVESLAPPEAEETCEVTRMIKKCHEHERAHRTLPSLNIDPRVINDSDQVSGAKSTSMSEN